MFRKHLIQFVVACLVGILRPLLIWVQPVKVQELKLSKFLRFEGQKAETVAPPGSAPPKAVEMPSALNIEESQATAPVQLFGEETRATAVSEKKANPFFAAEQAAPHNPLRDAYFGDTHVHTSLSLDAFISGTRTTPRDAYAYAKGAAIDHAAGYKIQLKQPLDFYMVTDHSEFFGLLLKAQAPKNTGLYDIEGIIDQISPESVRPDLSQSVWREIVQIADKNYEPGKFTTFPAYEWTSQGSDGNQNLHRNIIFRSSDAVPELPFTSFDSDKPEELWNFMDGLREKGITLLAIPHNSNVSDGLMFPMEDSYGNPLSKEYAEQRMRNEPIVEVTQIKGTSETHPLLSDTDEFANFEISDFKLNPSNLLDPDNFNTTNQVKGSYLRDAYKTGLVFEESIGSNPYKFGITAGTDTHNSGAPMEEDNYFGKFGWLDGTPKARLQIKAPWAETIRSWSASGVAAVWAEANTREAIYDAMARKESFGTTGPRIQVRLFGGWKYTNADAESKDFVAIGYRKGSPMGGDLAVKPDGAQAPTFIAAAMKDPNTANLDRIQIVKGWSKNGQSYEKVYDVALADGRKVDPETGKAPPVGNTVDITEATYTNTIGDVQLSAFWSDPDFDPEARAFYYARVLEIPTPRWSTYDALKLGIPIPADLPATIQERAYTSPIWYTPSEDLLAKVRQEMTTPSSPPASTKWATSTTMLRAMKRGM